jgi:DNA repair protein RecO
MPLIDDDALVLDARPYRDRHQVISFLTRHHGIVPAVLRNARSGRAPKAAATQILSHVSLTAHRGANAEMATCHEVYLVTSSYSLASDLGRSTAAAVVAELLTTFVPPGETDDRPFRLGLACLEALLGGASAAMVVAYAETWCLRLAGLQSDMDEDDHEPPPNGTRLFLDACRRGRPEALEAPPSAATAKWLDRRVRSEAERGLPALSFFRTTAGDGG